MVNYFGHFENFSKFFYCYCCVRFRTYDILLKKLTFPNSFYHRATQLEQEHYYLFSVTARTIFGYGKTAKAIVLTTNNREPPQPPSTPQISRSQIQSKQITFSWTPGRDGFAPLRYYIVQKSENGGPWQTLPERIDPQLTSYTVSDLKPFTTYKFRIQATNDIGPSGFSHESTDVRTYPAGKRKDLTENKKNHLKLIILHILVICSIVRPKNHVFLSVCL